MRGLSLPLTRQTTFFYVLFLFKAAGLHPKLWVWFDKCNRKERRKTYCIKVDRRYNVCIFYVVVEIWKVSQNESIMRFKGKITKKKGSHFTQPYKYVKKVNQNLQPLQCNFLKYEKNPTPVSFSSIKFSTPIVCPFHFSSLSVRLLSDSCRNHKCSKSNCTA